jgi:GT2 family glycosyltransferase
MIDQAGSVSAVICVYTFDRLDDVVAAVASVADQTRPPVEILVVVDHNPPLEGEVEARTNGRARIVANKYERGLSGARNTGVAYASGDFVMFLDDDAKAHPECLERLLVAFDDPRVIGAGGWIYPAWPSKPRWFPDEFLWTVGCSYRGLAPGPTRNLLGAAMCMRRSLFTRVGGFDSSLGRSASARLPHGCEETGFCIRATQTIENSLFVLEPEAHITHTVTRDRTKLRYFIKRCYAEGLSKARLAASVGSDRSLASERSYVTKTLARGFLRNLGDLFLRRDPSGFLRASAIGVGLACTVAGFFVARANDLAALGAVPRKSNSQALAEADQ